MTAELLLFTFTTVLSKSGSDQPLINLFDCHPRGQLSLLSHIHPTPSSHLIIRLCSPLQEIRQSNDIRRTPLIWGTILGLSLPAEINGFAASMRGSLSVNTEDLISLGVMGDRADHLLL